MAIRVLTPEESSQKKGIAPTTPVSVTKTPTVHSSGLRIVTPEELTQRNIKSAPVKPIEPVKTIEEQKNELRAQGKPVSMKPDRVEPTFGGNLLRAPLKLGASVVESIRKPFGALFSKETYSQDPNQKVAEQFDPQVPVKSDYLGDIYPVGYNKSGPSAKKVVGQAAEIASYGIGGPASGTAIKTGFQGAKQVASQGIKNVFKEGFKKATPFAIEGAVSGALGGGGTALQEDKTAGEVLRDTAIGAGIGTVATPLLAGAGSLAGKIAKRGTPEFKASQLQKAELKIDNDIRDLLSGTGDASKLEESAFKVKKGIDLLSKQKGIIKITDTNAPLGSNTKKPFDITKATPNEFIEAVNENSKEISNLARKGAENATNDGRILNLQTAEQSIKNAVDNKSVSPNTGIKLLNEIRATQGRPDLVHDWVQSINQKYKNKYERQTIDDTAIGSLADDIAQTLRRELDTVVDRSGYAEAFANNQELKKLIISIAKKANKNINIPELVDDFAVDSMFSLMTGNPLYAGRSIVEAGIKKLLNHYKGTRLFNTIKKTAIKDLGTGARMPSSGVKPNLKTLPLLNKGTGETFNNAPVKPIQLPRSITKTNKGLDEVENTVINTEKPKQSLKDKLLKPQPGFISTAFKNSGDLTTKILKDLEGKTTVSKQYILDATNRGELKQVERDLIRQVLDDMTSKNHVKTAFHGTNQTFENFDLNGKVKSTGSKSANEAIFFTDNKIEADTYARLANKKISSNEKLLQSETKRLQKEIDLAQRSGNWQKYEDKITELEDLEEKLLRSDKEVKNIMERGIDTRNFKEVDMKDKPQFDLNLTAEIKKAKKENYDGVVFKNIKDPASYDVSLPETTTHYAVFNPKAIVKSQGDTINVKEFADKVKAELLPLNRMRANTAKYEFVTLPKEVRGNVKDYRENVYESPIKTSAGDTHFGNSMIVQGAEFKSKPDSYFGHTRIEDMADNKTRRVIEVQSDLYQKGNLEREIGTETVFDNIKDLENNIEDIKNKKVFPKIGNVERNKIISSEQDKVNDLRKMISQRESKKKLQQYNDPTAHFRMIREEIKKAAQDGKTKLQFPTGETAMKIEGLGTNTQFWNSSNRGLDITKPEQLEIGKQLYTNGDSWIITDVLGDGKFRAVPQRKSAGFVVKDGKLVEQYSQNGETKYMDIDPSWFETFDISGKVDTNNPIYKFYEKDVQKYLNKFGGKRVVDDKGVSWIEIPITKEQGKQPVEAFGMIPLGPLGAISGTSALGVLGKAMYDKKQQKKPSLSLGKNKTP